MRAAANEFRVPLQNMYPLTNPANHDVQIQELRWDDGNDWITLWLHEVNGQWIVLDSRRWDKNVVF